MHLPTAAPPTRPAEIASTYLDAWAAGDPDRIAALHAPGTRFELHAPDGPGPALGRAAVRDAFTEVFAAWPGFSFVTHRLLYGDAHWVLDWTLVASPAGREIRIDLVDIVTVSPAGLVDRKDSYLVAGGRS